MLSLIMLVYCSNIISNQCTSFFTGLKSKERLSTQEEWMSGHVPVIVATISFGMGVDKADVRYSVH